jgi:hypothetical protein
MGVMGAEMPPDHRCATDGYATDGSCNTDMTFAGFWVGWPVARNFLARWHWQKEDSGLSSGLPKLPVCTKLGQGNGPPYPGNRS